eukprot:Skav204436  [mRNA]  locus=scaffold1093:205958:209098:+ [translate_table: standard]
MAPKHAAKRNAAAAKKGAKPKLVPEPPKIASTDAINAEVQSRLAAHDALIKDHFDDLVTGAPTDHSGYARYREVDAAAALGAGKPYVCACPLYWLNVSFEFQPNLPKYQKRIDNLETHFFEEPRNLSEPILVYVNPAEMPHKMKGSLRAFDAPEMRDALRQAVSNAISAKKGRKVMNEWHQILMGVPMRFEAGIAVIKNFSKINTYWSQKVTSLMRIYEIMDFKRQLEIVTEEKQNKVTLHAHYKGLKMAQSSEEVSISFIEVANMLYFNMLNSPRIQQLCFTLDQEPVNPLDSIYKLREIAIICEKKEPLMFWALGMLCDWWHLKDGRDSIPIRALKDTASDVSLVKLMIFKKQLKEKLVRQMDTDFPLWTEQVKNEIRAATESIQSCRKLLGVYDDDENKIVYEPRGSWPESADRFLLIFEAVIYGWEHDETIMAQLKNRRSVDDVLDCKSIKAFVDKAKELYNKETADPDEVEEEKKKDMEAAAEIVADELAVSANLSQAEALLKQMESGALEIEAGDELLATIKAGLRVAERRVAAHVNFAVDWNSDEKDDLSSQIKNLPITKIRGDEESKAYVAIVLDSKVVCESGSQAKYRLPPTRAAQMQRLLDAVLCTREDGDLSEGDALVVLDGGRDETWLNKSVLKFLPAKKYEVNKHILVYTYESVEKRMERASKAALSLHEGVHFISHAELKIKVQPRLHTQGNTRGNVLGPYNKASWTDSSETWLLPSAVKREVFGKDNLPLPGGSCPIEHEKDAAAKNSELVPVFFHDSPPVVAQEILHYLQAKMVVDLTPACGNHAFECLRKRVPYLGICLSERHRDLLMKKLVSRTMAAMSDSADDCLYDATFAQALKKASESADALAESKETDIDKKKTEKKRKNTNPDDKKKKQQKPEAKEEPEPSSSDNTSSRDELMKKIQAAAAESS